MWRLLRQMASVGLESAVALATDMADARLWARLGNGPGLAGLPGRIRTRLQREGFSGDTISGLVGRNIARRLARASPDPI